jgi:CDGSH-type Zn-finger protein
MKITIQENGPYVVEGHVPLVRKVQVVTEFGEPIAWEKEGDIQATESYELCRCGHSADKPFCDSSHNNIEWDGTETAEANTTAERRELDPGGKQIVVHRDYSLCASAGFCGTRLTNIKRMLAQAAPDDTAVRSQIIAMIERCPSGSYTYTLEGADGDNEPDLPAQIAVTTEITSSGPIEGPLWVSGGIPIERADGQPMETRNRLTLCRCGLSGNKPLCDGSHRAEH